MIVGIEGKFFSKSRDSQNGASGIAGAQKVALAARRSEGHPRLARRLNVEACIPRDSKGKPASKI